MTAVQTITEVLTQEEASLPSPADLAVAAFLARYSGRTFEAYRHDLRTYFQWASDAGLEVFAATRGHIELYRATLEERGLAATTIDRRLSTVCGFYRFAHIDGRIGSNPAQYVRRPRIFANEVRGMDRGELGAFLFTAGVPLRDVQLAARHEDPRTTTIYDRRRANFDRHAAYVVVAFVAGG